jgi:hypothetical protein
LIKNLVKYKFSSGNSLDVADFVDLDDLMLDHGLLVSGSWEQLNFKEDTKLYIKSLLENGDDLFKPARIKVSTIHGVKGEECENVVLYTGMEKIIYDAALRNLIQNTDCFCGCNKSKRKSLYHATRYRRLL